MKTFLKPVVKASERFFVTADGEGAARGVLLGVAVAGGVEQVRRVRLAGKGGALGESVQWELRRGADVFVVHGVVVGEAVTVWSVEVHVTPERVALSGGSVARSPSKFAARVKMMVGRTGLRSGGIAASSLEVVAKDTRALSAAEALM